MSSLVGTTAGKTPPPMDCKSSFSQSGQVDVMAVVTYLKKKMVDLSKLRVYYLDEIENNTFLTPISGEQRRAVAKTPYLSRKLKGANMSALRTYKTLTLAEKIAAIKEIEMGIKKKSDIAKDFGIPRNTLSTYLKNKEKILRSESELREPGNPDLDKCVLKWFKQARDKKIPVSGHLIRSKAEQFATEMGKPDFKASSGWLDGFKERNKISFKTICGESGAVNLQVAEQWKNNLRELIQDKDARDVFNVDETGLFFKCTPDKTLAFKHEKCHGGKLSKERVTLLVGANMDGSEKLPLLMIGKAANPLGSTCINTSPLSFLPTSKTCCKMVLRNASQDVQ
ncbi:hypothetical protein LAZ67_5001237 [Cordylochernes scorpioides]|uniref:HTH CENPB-type domain-containing protein n=1 Tax=Cordylochernes scorpioides TaxID=51811 RepID=A0ABY6KFE7_9ARAC|nr:hypothetical protein LAZ67_5001237 [Cordylochernes scorpioides]